jgi:hypothetical protein
MRQSMQFSFQILESEELFCLSGISKFDVYVTCIVDTVKVKNRTKTAHFVASGRFFTFTMSFILDVLVFAIPLRSTDLFVNVHYVYDARSREHHISVLLISIILVPSVTYGTWIREYRNSFKLKKFINLVSSITHPHQAPRSRMSRAIPLLPLWALRGLLQGDLTFVTSIGSRNARYALTVPHISECWPENCL